MAPGKALIKNSLNRLCQLNKKNGGARKQLFANRSVTGKRQIVTDWTNCAKFSLANSNKLSLKTRKKIRSQKLALKRLIKEKDFKKKSTLARRQIGSGLFGAIAKGLASFVQNL